MQITKRLAGRKLWLYLEGDLDECTAAQMRRAADEILDEHPLAREVIFNLSGVRFMDSTGIGFLIGRYKKIQRFGGKMYLEDPDLSADKVLSVSGVYSLIPKL